MEKKMSKKILHMSILQGFFKKISYVPSRKKQALQKSFNILCLKTHTKIQASSLKNDIYSAKNHQM